MKATVRWVNNAMFLGESGSGHTVVMDGPEDSGGRNLGVRPMEMLLLGTGGCSSCDVVNILRKSRQDIVDCVVDMEATRADGVPAVFESIHMHFKVTGNNLSEKQVERAVHLSADKYCSASIMLGEAGVKVTHSFEIVTP